MTYNFFYKDERRETEKREKRQFFLKRSDVSRISDNLAKFTPKGIDRSKNAKFFAFSCSLLPIENTKKPLKTLKSCGHNTYMYFEGKGGLNQKDEQTKKSILSQASNYKSADKEADFAMKFKRILKVKVQWLQNCFVKPKLQNLMKIIP